MALLYPAPHDHTRYPDHEARVEASIAMAREMVPRGGYVVDLSCGDAAVARALQESHDVRLTLGDYAAGYEFQGRMEVTAKFITGPVDLWILTETLEHLNRPERVLESIRAKSRALLVSTPVEGEDGENPEHIWSWTADDVAEMLWVAGWTAVRHEVVSGDLYSFGLWGCE